MALLLVQTKKPHEIVVSLLIYLLSFPYLVNVGLWLHSQQCEEERKGKWCKVNQKDGVDFT